MCIGVACMYDLCEGVRTPAKGVTVMSHHHVAAGN